MLKQILTVLTLLAAGAEAQAAQRLGAPFQINTSAVSGRPTASSIAPLKPGGFVVAWLSERPEPEAHDLNAQVYNNQGTRIGGTFLIDSGVRMDQAAAIAGLADGSFVAIWQRFNVNDNSFYLFGRRFDVTGVPLGAKFVVRGAQIVPPFASVAALQGGGFVVVWDSDGDDLGGDVSGQRFDAAGLRVGAKFRLHSKRAGAQLAPKAAGLRNGDFLAVWLAFTPNEKGIFGQRFDAQGARVGTEFQISRFASTNFPSIAALRNGTVIATWDTRNGILAQRFNANGSRAGDVFNLKPHGSLGAVAALANGGIVLTWTISGGSLFTQTYDALAQPTSGILPVNNSAGQHAGVYPGAAGLSNGHFVVTWTDFQSDGVTAESFGYFGQRFSP